MDSDGAKGIEGEALSGRAKATACLIPFAKGDPRINREGPRVGNLRVADRLWMQLKKDVANKSGSTVQAIDGICMKLTQLALQGNIRAIELIFAAVEPKGKTAVTVSIEDEDMTQEQRQERIRSLIKRFNLSDPIETTATETLPCPN